MSLPGPKLTRWNRPAEPCRGCPGCSIRNQLDERETFTRGEVAHLLALAFRSGAELAHDMAENVHYWAQQPIVRRTAEQNKRRRLAEMAESAERQRIRNLRAAALRNDPYIEWPEVAIPGATGGE